MIEPTDKRRSVVRNGSLLTITEIQYGDVHDDVREFIKLGIESRYLREQANEVFIVDEYDWYHV